MLGIIQHLRKKPVLVAEHKLDRAADFLAQALRGRRHDSRDELFVQTTDPQIELSEGFF